MLNLALATILLLPQIAQPNAAEIDTLFPQPSGPLTLEVSDPETSPTLESLVRTYCELTGQNVVLSPDSETILKNCRIPLLNTLTVPASEVQVTFEQLLRQNDFVLRVLKDDGVRLLELSSLATTARNNMRSYARYLSPEEVGLAGQHPAMLFTTVVSMQHSDVRQVSNSMRTLITDANTQQMLPAGNSSSMVLVGFGDTIRDLVDTLLTVDARSAAEGAAANRLNEVIRLENSRATELAGLLQRALGLSLEQPQASDPKILGDERSNSLIVSATAERLASIKALIAALDAK